MIWQRTLRQEVAIAGRGLHGGEPVRLTLRPSPPDSGRCFVRLDRGGAEVPVSLDCLATLGHATRLEREGVRVDTPEHLLAALVALGVDNVRIEIDGPEVPILDGSALPFVEALRRVGLLEQDAPRRYLTLSRSVELEEDGKRMTLEPCPELRITYAIDFEHPRLGYQELTCEVFRPLEFALKLAPARTFVLERDLPALRRGGLVRGGSLDNALVIGDEGPLGGAGLRFPDEYVRHKMLDLLGDLALLGHPLRAHVLAYRGGHALHARMVRRVLSTPDAWYLSTWPGEAGPEFGLEDLQTIHGRAAVV